MFQERSYFSTQLLLSLQSIPLTQEIDIAGNMTALRELPLHFLAPIPKIMADLMTILEEQKILAPVQLFYPVFNVIGDGNAEIRYSCKHKQDRLGVIIEGSTQADRQV